MANYNIFAKFYDFAMGDMPLRRPCLRSSIIYYVTYNISS
jgi:hypothetical protein